MSDLQVMPPEQTQALAASIQEPPNENVAKQAKNDAIASLTLAAYARASELKLTDQETKALQADFPDEAFQPGAAGKEHLIYIQHAYLRDRFIQVFGMGQWAIIPRNRWVEQFRTQKGTEASRVYVEAMLVIRGCFCAEAIGEMEYYPNNASQNYGDAVEGAKTAALRRCAKELGVGLQAWKKEFGDGWWDRKRNGRPAQQTTQQMRQPAQQTTPPTQQPATTRTREWMVKALEPMRDKAISYYQAKGLLKASQTIADLDLQNVATTKPQLEAIIEEIKKFVPGSGAGVTDTPRQPPATSQQPLAAAPDPWRIFPMPYGRHAGKPLAELDKKYLYGLWLNYKVEAEYNGHPIAAKQIEANQLFRDMLDQAGAFYQFTAPTQ